MDDKTFELMTAMYSEMQKGFKQIDKRFEDIDQRFLEIDKRFEQIDERFEEIDRRFEQIDERFDKMDERFDRLEKRVEGCESCIRKMDARIEYKLFPKIEALFDATCSNGERLMLTEKNVKALTERVDSHEFDIQLLKERKVE